MAGDKQGQSCTTCICVVTNTVKIMQSLTKIQHDIAHVACLLISLFFNAHLKMIKETLH